MAGAFPWEINKRESFSAGPAKRRRQRQSGKREGNQPFGGYQTRNGGRGKGMAFGSPESRKEETGDGSGQGGVDRSWPASPKKPLGGGTEGGSWPGTGRTKRLCS